MKIIVDNNIRLSELNEIEYRFLDLFCKKDLSIDNPERENNKRLGFPYYNLPAKLYWYEKRGNDFIVPFGCINKIYSIFPSKEVYHLQFKKTEKLEFKSNIKLFDYQQKACEMAFKKKNGVIVMPAGSGKTQTALQLISRLGLKTLWITHTYDLLNQSYDRAKSNLENVGLGKIAAGKIDIGTHITFATVQTLQKLDLSELESVINDYAIDLELRKNILQLTALNILYSKNTTLRYGYARAQKFIEEFNEQIPNLNLSTEEIDKIKNNEFICTSAKIKTMTKQ